MYPLNAILVGCPANLQSKLRELLASQSVSIEGDFPSVSMAIDRLRGVNHGPRLFVFYIDAAPELPELRRLRDAFVGEPILTILFPRVDSTQMLNAMRMGASQVVPQPISDDDFRAALDCLSLQFGFRGRQGVLIAVQSVTGGCGATTLALNLAHEIAQRKQTTVILTELSLRMGMLAALLDLEPAHTTYDLFANMHRLDLHLVEEALVPINDQVRLLAGPNQLAPLMPVTAPDVLRLSEYLRRLADVVVVDLPSSFDEIYFEVLAGADHFLMVAEQRLSSVRALQLYHEAVERDPLFQKGTLRKHFLLNRYNPKLEGFGAAKLCELLRLPELLTVDDDAVSAAAATTSGTAIRLQNPRSPVLDDLGIVISKLYSEPPAPPAVKKISPSKLGLLARAIGLSS